MGWSSPDSWPTRIFSGEPIAILIALFVAVLLPVLVHLYFYRPSARIATTPTFLLLGPSGSGKTSLLNLLQRTSSDPSSSSAPATRTSSISSSPVSLRLHSSIPIGSNKYRSANDDSSLVSTPYKLIDTPGHGKLRAENAMSFLSDPSLRGVIFFVDVASLDTSDTSHLRDAAAYLHDVLLWLQRRKSGKDGRSKLKDDMPVLVAANKQDLFTALPPGAVRDRLESEIGRVRSSRTRGLVTVGQDLSDDPEDELGGGGEKFSFKMLGEEYGINVDMIGGAVSGEEAGKGVKRWEEWIGGCL